VEEVLDTLAAEAARKHLVLVYQLDEAVPATLVGDVMRVRQVLTNLLTNAVRFTDVGEVVLSVVSRPLSPSAPAALPPGSAGDGDDAPPFESDRVRYEVHFAVRDTGIGIPQEALGLLFRPFSQVNSSTTRTYGGTGLGLAISKRLTEMMGGKIWVESQVGEGSTFHFTMVVTASPVEQSPSPPDTRSHILRGKRLLIADDNRSSAHILTQQVREWGMVPETTSLSREALDWLQHGGPFDAAVLNMHAPDMDSLTLATAVQIAPNGRTLPLVVFLSIDQRIEASREWDHQATVLLSRPMKPFQLRDSLVSLFTGEHATSATRGRPQHLERGLSLHPTLSAVQHPLRILLAEDDAGNQRVTLSLLAHMEYHGVEVASDGQTVLSLLEHQSYDVVLMDVQMPHMDGFETTRRIRETFPADRQPWIIAMTAHAMQGDRERCLSAGMDDYISKPVWLAELETVLRKAPRTPEPLPSASNDQRNDQRNDQHEEPIIHQSKETGVPHERNLLNIPSSPDLPEGPPNGVLRVSAVVPPLCFPPANPAPSPAPPRSNGVLDPTRFRQFLATIEKGGPRVVSEIIGIFVNDMQNRVTSIGEAVAEGNPHNLQAAAHSLKSLSAQVGGMKLSKVSETLEMLALAEDMSEVTELAEQARDAFAPVRQALLAARPSASGSASSPDPSAPRE
jgi:CheY-like chemotaxis protein/HPt (histidine-containing phosphotransfer) domain-containing protein